MSEIIVPSLDVRLPSYVGPLPSLLTLIKRGKMSIWEVRLSEIVEGFLSLINVMRELNLRICEDFIDITSSLIVLKSRMLLSRDEDSYEEETYAPFERNDLEKYTSFLDSLPLLNRDTFVRRERIREEGNLDLMILLQTFMSLKRAGEEKTLTIEMLKPSLEEKLREIEERLLDKGIYVLDTNGDENLRDKLVTILSILELAKRKLAKILQYRPFGRIIVKRRE